MLKLWSKLPRVSVIIPTHNRKYKLFKCIESVLNSNYPRGRLEIIVIDDASTDGTYEAVKKYYPQVKIIKSNEELLPSGARNLGGLIAKGEILFFVDDDNIIDKNCIIELVKVLTRDSTLGLVSPISIDPQTERVIKICVKRNMFTSICKKK